MKLTRLWAVVDGLKDWLVSLFFDTPPLYVNAHRVEQELRRKPREADDDYSAEYVAQVQRRIVDGKSPERPLIRSRPGLLYFKEAVTKKQLQRDARGRWLRRAAQ